MTTTTSVTRQAIPQRVTLSEHLERSERRLRRYVGIFWALLCCIGVGGLELANTRQSLKSFENILLGEAIPALETGDHYRFQEVVRLLSASQPTWDVNINGRSRTWFATSANPSSVAIPLFNLVRQTEAETNIRVTPRLPLYRIAILLFLAALSAAISGAISIFGVRRLARSATAPFVTWIQSRPIKTSSTLEIAEIHELEMQLQRMQMLEKSAAVGEWAGQFAHDLQSPMAGLKMVLDNWNDRSPEAQQLAQLVSNRFQNLLAELLRRHRDSLIPGLESSVTEPKDENKVEILAILNESLAVATKVASHVTWETNFEISGIETGGSKDVWHRIFDNLLLNARQAMPLGSGAKVSVKTFRSSTGTPIVEIRDNGPGFPDSVLELGLRVGAPIPSSKRSDQAGLGLGWVRDQLWAIDLNLLLRNDHGAVIQIEVPNTMSN